MSKAIVVPASTRVDSGIISVNYTVSIIGPPNVSYSADYIVNTGISVAANLLAWQNKVIADAATRGVTLLLTDVITFGAPT